jgi:hypothetical protein
VLVWIGRVAKDGAQELATPNCEDAQECVCKLQESIMSVMNENDNSSSTYPMGVFVASLEPYSSVFANRKPFDGHFVVFADRYRLVGRRGRY